MNPFTLARRLRKLGVLGINERNADYTLRHNPRRLYPRVDDKIRTKQICHEFGIPTARVLAQAATQAEVHELVARLRRPSVSSATTSTAFASRTARVAPIASRPRAASTRPRTTRTTATAFTACSTTR